MNGILNLLKPPGMTSHDAVSLIRRLTGVRRTGHTGTLDPGAAGVLPICIGKATRVAEYFLDMQKMYRAEITLGKATETEDAAGKVISKKKVPHISEASVRSVLKGFVGEQMQLPPMYSAVRVDGEKLYERARRGETVYRKPRHIHIYRLELLSVKQEKIMFDVSCSRGTYIRTLCREISEALGSVGHMSFLLRTGVGPFSIEKAVTLEECAAAHESSELDQFIEPLDTALLHMPAVEVTADEAKKVLNGVSLPYMQEGNEGNMLRVYGPNRQLIAVSQLQQGCLRPRKVFS